MSYTVFCFTVFGHLFCLYGLCFYGVAFLFSLHDWSNTPISCVLSQNHNISNFKFIFKNQHKAYFSCFLFPKTKTKPPKRETNPPKNRSKPSKDSKNINKNHQKQLDIPKTSKTASSSSSRLPRDKPVDVDFNQDGRMDRLTIFHDGRIEYQERPTASGSVRGGGVVFGIPLGLGLLFGWFWHMFVLPLTILQFLDDIPLGICVLILMIFVLLDPFLLY